MILVDTNVHVTAKELDKHVTASLDQPRDDRRYDSAQPSKGTDMNLDEYLECMDQVDVQQAILSGRWTDGDDNDYPADSAARCPERFVSIGNFDAFHPEVSERMAYWIQERGVQAVRFFKGNRVDEPEWLDDPRLIPAWQQAAALRVPIDMARLGEATIPKFRKLIELYPDIPTIVSYLGHPVLDDGPPYSRAKELLSLAEFPNVYAKIGPGNILEARKGRSTPEAFFTLLVKSFGSRRLMWSSYYPGGRDSSYREIVDLFRSTLAFLGNEDKEWLFGETARTLYPSLREL